LLGHLCFNLLSIAEATLFLQLDHEPVCCLGLIQIVPERKAPAAGTCEFIISSEVLVLWVKAGVLCAPAFVLNVIDVGVTRLSGPCFGDVGLEVAEVNVFFHFQGKLCTI